MKKVEFPFFDDFGEVKGSRQYALTKLVLLGTENVEKEHYYYCELKDNGKWVSFNKKVDGKEMEEKSIDELFKNNVVISGKYVAIN
jgi:hypothetical protein